MNGRAAMTVPPRKWSTAVLVSLTVKWRTDGGGYGPPWLGTVGSHSVTVMKDGLLLRSPGAENTEAITRTVLKPLGLLPLRSSVVDVTGARTVRKRRERQPRQTLPPWEERGVGG